MSNTVNFCTCGDTNCPYHPTNHDKGCTPCIFKNLKLREIPSCFWNIAGGTEGQENFFFEDFAKRIIDNQK